VSLGFVSLGFVSLGVFLKCYISEKECFNIKRESVIHG